MIHSLNTVDMGGNMIQAVEEDSLVSLPNLIGLKLDHNRIRAIHKNAFSRLSNLQILNLGGNRIGEIERGSFNQNKKLQAIRLDANNITDIVGLFSDLQSLRWLNISDNRISRFDYFLMPRSDLNENARNQEICCLISSRNLFDPRLDKIQYLHINCIARGRGVLLNLISSKSEVLRLMKISSTLSLSPFPLLNEIDGVFSPKLQIIDRFFPHLYIDKMSFYVDRCCIAVHRHLNLSSRSNLNIEGLSTGWISIRMKLKISAIILIENLSSTSTRWTSPSTS